MKILNGLLVSGFLFLCASGEGQTVRIGFAGDIMLSYEMTSFLESHGPHYPFTGTSSIFRGFDLFCANLECPISDIGLPLQNKSFYFRAEPWAVRGLTYAGIGLVSLANNHILDFGDEALFRTMEILSNAGIARVGAGRNAAEASALRIMTVRKIRFGFLAYNLTGPDVYRAGPSRPGVAVCDEKTLTAAVREAAGKADHVFVLFHWGEEYASRPNELQTRLARAAVDAGASGVIGAHPHVIQPVEIYKSRPIAYSLGNYAFGSWGRPPDRTADAGLILEIEADRKSIRRVVLHPINVFNYEVKFNPRPLPAGGSAEAALKAVANPSSGWVITNGRAEIFFGKN